MKLRHTLPGTLFAVFNPGPNDGRNALTLTRPRPGTASSSDPRRRNLRPSGQRNTLRVRIIAALMGIMFIPLLVTTIGGIQIARASLARQGDQTLHSRALARANQIDTYLTSARNSIVAARTQLGTRYQSYLTQSDPATQQSLLLDMRTALHTATYNARGQSTALIDTTGHIVVSDVAAESGNALAASPAVRTALTGIATISGVAYSPNAPPDQQATVELAVPVFTGDTGGQVIGALRERLSLQQITSWVDEDTIATGGGLLVEPGIGLIIAQSGQPGAFFSSLQPLSTDLLQQLIDSQQYVPGQGEKQPALATHSIPGISLTMLQSNGPQEFTAGSLDGKQHSGIRYARITLSSVPWVYLLATSEATFTAPADSLILFALIVAAISLAAAVAASLFSSWGISRQLFATLTQLQRIAEGFTHLSTDQVQTASAQHRYLDTTRSELHKLQQTSGDLAQTLDTALRAAQAQRHERMTQQQTPQAYATWWRQWQEAVFPRLQYQFDVCSNIRQGIQYIARTSMQSRQRTADLYAQATAVDTSLARGSFGLMGAGGARRAFSLFGPRNVRLALLGLLMAFGLLPSLIFVAASSTPLRENLTNLSDQILLSRARSDASATISMLNRQEQSVVSIALPRLYADALNSAEGKQSAQQSLVSAAPDPATSTLELVNADTGQVVVTSGAPTEQADITNLPALADARKGMVSVSPAFYDPARQQAWYYIAVPISSLDNTHIAGIAIGIFSFASIWSLQNKLANTTDADSPAYLLMIERADGMIVADSRQPKGTFTASAALDQTTLNALWKDGRYPQGETPPNAALPELSHTAVQPLTSLAPRRLTGQAGAGQPKSQYWLVPLSGTPWLLVEAQSLPVTTAVADGLTRLDLLLSLAVLVLASALAILLGRSISAPLLWINRQLRDLAQHLVKLAHLYQEQIERLEQALPPIDGTAQALGNETDEVVMILFAPSRTSSQPSGPRSPAQGTPPYSPSGNLSWPTPWSNPQSLTGLQSQGNMAGGINQIRSLPSSVLMSNQEPSIEHLQRAQILASGWRRRQQRISFNIAVAINATNDSLRVSGEGQQAAHELADASAELLASTL